MTLDYIAQSINSSPDLDGVAITDHSFAIYFPVDMAWSWKYMINSSIFDEYRDRGNAILDKHLQEIKQRKHQHLIPGIEVEMMHDGRFTIDPELLKNIDLVIGSIHWLDIPENATSNEIIKIWEYNTFKLMDKGINILGHPFRWLSNRIPFISDEIIKKTVKAAKKSNVALELNSHLEIDTDLKMMQEIVEQNASVAFATDAHRQTEIADFSYHKGLMLKAGISPNDLNLFTPET